MAKVKAKVWLVSYEVHDCGWEGEFMTKKDVVNGIGHIDDTSATVKKLKVMEVK